MKSIIGMVGIATLLISAATYASQERVLPWSQLRLVSAGVDDSGEISIVAQISPTSEWQSVECAAFGRKYTLDENQRAQLRGCRANSVVVCYESRLRTIRRTYRPFSTQEIDPKRQSIHRS